MSAETPYEEYWQNDADTFGLFFDAAVQLRVPSILSVYGELRRPERVLDYGCGNGALTYWLHRCGFGSEVVGIDISQTAVKRAQRRFKEPGLTFETFDPESSLQHLGRFDVIVCSHVLEHLSEPLKAVAQMKAVSDLFVFEVPLEDCLAMHAKAAWKRCSLTEISDQHLQFWNRNSFEDLLTKTELRLVRRRIYSAGPDFGNPSMLKQVVQKGIRVLNERLYGRVFGTRYTALLWRDPIA